MYKKLLSITFLLTFLLYFSVPAHAQPNRQSWISCITNWCSTMEKDGNWKYYSGQGEITDYRKNRATQRYSNCALMISHALQTMDVLKSNQKIYAKVSSGDIRTVYSGSGTEAAIRNHCRVYNLHGNLTVTELITQGGLLRGDIVCFYGMQHTAVYMGTVGNNSYWYDAGRSGTSTGKEAGIWNTTFSLLRTRDFRYLNTASWRVNDVLRFPEEAPNTTVKATSVAKNTIASPQNTKSSTTVTTTVKDKQHILPSVTGISYKLKNNHVYLSFTVKNNCKSKEKITMSYYLGTRTRLGSGKSKKTFTLAAGKKKTFKNVSVSLNSVNATRCYVSLKMTSHARSSLVKKCKVKLPVAYKTASTK